MSDLIRRQDAIDALKQQAETMSEWSNRYAEQRKGVLTAVNVIEDLPSAQPKQLDWMERNKERILQAGMKGREIEFRIGGRLFAIREKAQ